MSHKSLAAIWAKLALRKDIDNILCELIGQHSLELSILTPGSDELRKNSLRLAVSLKIVFDLQRTYHNQPLPGSDPAYLLTPQKLLLAILHLLRIKSTIFPCPTKVQAAYLPQQSFLAQATVSGLRALSLRGLKLSSSQQTQLKSNFNDAWTLNYRLDPIDEFIIQKLCPRLVDQLCRTPNEVCSLACGEIQSRDYATGLYPLESRLSELVTPVSTYISKLGGGSDWFKAYCVLFDIVWMAEAALIQLCVNLTRPSHNKNQNQPTRKDVDSLIATRKAVLDAGRHPKSQISDSIFQILLVPCGQGPCTCLQELNSQFNLLRSGSNNLSLSDSSLIQCDATMVEILNNSLDEFVMWLSSREKTLWNSNGELSELSESFDQHMAKWYLTAAGVRHDQTSIRPGRRKAYTLACPQLHPIPYDILRGLIVSSEGPGLEKLDNNSPLFQVSINCSQCVIPYGVKWVRQIEPLQHLSTDLEKSLQRTVLRHTKPEPSPEARPDAPPRRGSSESSTVPSFVSRGSGTLDSAERQFIVKKGKLEDLMGALTGNLKSRDTPSYCFSTDGQVLLVWFKNANFISLYDIRADQFMCWKTEPIMLAAAGAKRYAVVSLQGNAHHTLHVYESNSGNSAPSLDLVGTNVCCIAFSRNDRFVGLGSKNKVSIFDNEDQSIRHYELECPAESTLQSQRIAFSADSLSFIIATRYNTGCVHSYVSECARNTMESLRLSIPQIPTRLPNDYGLSSVLVDIDAGFACITAFTSRVATVILSLRSQTIHYPNRGALSDQIQCAAQTSSGFKLVLVDVKNQVHLLHRQVDGVWHAKKKVQPWPRRSVARGWDRMAIAMPDDDTIHLFGFSDKEWRLFIIDM